MDRPKILFSSWKIVRLIKNKKIHARDIKSFVKKFIQFPVSKYMMEHKDVDTVGVKIKNKSICCL